MEDLGRTPGFLGWIFWTIIFYYWLSWCKIIKVFRPVFCPFLKMSLHWSTHKQERYKGPTLTIQRGKRVPILKISGSVTIFTLHYTLWPYNLESNRYKSGNKKTVYQICKIEGNMKYKIVTHMSKLTPPTFLSGSRTHKVKFIYSKKATNFCEIFT